MGLRQNLSLSSPTLSLILNDMRLILVLTLTLLLILNLILILILILIPILILILIQSRRDVDMMLWYDENLQLENCTMY